MIMLYTFQNTQLCDERLDVFAGQSSWSLEYLSGVFSVAYGAHNFVNGPVGSAARACRYVGTEAALLGRSVRVSVQIPSPVPVLLT